MPIHLLRSFSPGGGGRGGAPYRRLYGEVLPEWGAFAALQVYEMVGKKYVITFTKRTRFRLYIEILILKSGTEIFVLGM